MNDSERKSELRFKMFGMDDITIGRQITLRVECYIASFGCR